VRAGKPVGFITRADLRLGRLRSSEDWNRRVPNCYTGCFLEERLRPGRAGPLFPACTFWAPVHLRGAGGAGWLRWKVAGQERTGRRS